MSRTLRGFVHTTFVKALRMQGRCKRMPSQSRVQAGSMAAAEIQQRTLPNPFHLWQQIARLLRQLVEIVFENLVVHLDALLKRAGLPASQESVQKAFIHYDFLRVFQTT